MKVELDTAWATARHWAEKCRAAEAGRDRYRKALEAVRYEIEGDSDWTADRWGDAALEALQVIREALDA